MHPWENCADRSDSKQPEMPEYGDVLIFIPSFLHTREIFTFVVECFYVNSVVMMCQGDISNTL